MQVRQLLSEREFLFILKYKNNVYGAFIYLITVVCCVGTGVDVSVNYFLFICSLFPLKCCICCLSWGLYPLIAGSIQFSSLLPCAVDCYYEVFCRWRLS